MFFRFLTSAALGLLLLPLPSRTLHRRLWSSRVNVLLLLLLLMLLMMMMTMVDLCPPTLRG